MRPNILFLNYCSWKIRSLHTCLPILKLYQVENTTYIVFLQLMEHGIYAVSLSRALESHSNYSTYCYCFCFLGTDLLFPLILVAASALRPNHPSSFWMHVLGYCCFQYYCFFFKKNDFSFSSSIHSFQMQQYSINLPLHYLCLCHRLWCYISCKKYYIFCFPRIIW